MQSCSTTRIWITSLAVLLGLNVRTLQGCPLCAGEAGVNPVKSLIFGEDFWWNAASVIAPFALFSFIVVLIYFRFFLPPTEGLTPMAVPKTTDRIDPKVS